MYHERLGSNKVTHFGMNAGAGTKIALLGPIRARLDYRVFRLRGEPLHSVVHRVYAGLKHGDEGIEFGEDDGGGWVYVNGEWWQEEDDWETTCGPGL